MHDDITELFDNLTLANALLQTRRCRWSAAPSPAASLCSTIEGASGVVVVEWQ